MTPTQALLIGSHLARRAKWDSIAKQRGSARIKSTSFAPAPFPIQLALTPTPLPFDFFAAPSARNIMTLVALKHGVKVPEIMGTSQGHAISAARFEAIYLVRTHMPMSTPQIGRVFGGRDHTTVLNAITKHKMRIGVSNAA